MPNRINAPLRRNRLTSAIKLACSAGLLVSFALPISGVANEIVRSSRNAFNIPHDNLDHPVRQDNFVTHPAITNIDGQGYLQFILEQIEGAGIATYKNIIIGPFQALLDSTIPWENLIYSSEEFNPPRSQLTDGSWSLVDLDNDGEFEIYDVETMPIRLAPKAVDLRSCHACHTPGCIHVPSYNPS